MKVISGAEWKRKYGRVGYKAKTTEQIIADIVGVMEGALTGQVRKRTGALWKYDAATKKAVCRCPVCSMALNDPPRSRWRR